MPLLSICCQRRQREFKVGATKRRNVWHMGPLGWCASLPTHRGEVWEGQNFSVVISKWHILANSEVLYSKFLFIVSFLNEVRVDSLENSGFSSKAMNKCCHWARTTNIGLLYPKVRKNIGGDIPIDPPQPKYWWVCVPDILGTVDASVYCTRNYCDQHDMCGDASD